jgi:hypothetical protein
LEIAMHKCQVLHVGRNNPCRDFFIDNIFIDSPTCIKDLGISVTHDLCFTQHINDIVTSTYRRSNLIFKCFLTREPEFLKQMFVSFCRPKLEYNTCVWSPYLKKDIEMIEKVQRRYTKRIQGLHELTYAERLNMLGLDSLEYRRLVFDLCMTYCICRGLVDLRFEEFFTYAPAQYSTRGHSFKLLAPLTRCSARKNFFANRVINPWNSLPQSVVSAGSLPCFKARLKKANLTRFLNYPHYYEL